jgi:hypothetical protein
VSSELGDDLVIQTAFGDSGHTTFFISDEEDWDRHADEIVDKGEVKVMKRIRCRGSALEACVTRHGTIVGPLMTELVGFPELTPYRGGWCGNEVFAEAFPAEVREQARRPRSRFGEELRKMGYRGYFELDFLTDLDTDEVYLGEVNPRITGASAMTNLASFAHADAPLFLFHLLEWSDLEFELDVEELNARWADPENIDSWSQLVIKHTARHGGAHHPGTPVRRLAHDGLGPDRVPPDPDPSTNGRGGERGFFLRITRAGDYRYKGADLGILITPGTTHDGRSRAERSGSGLDRWDPGSVRGGPGGSRGAAGDGPVGGGGQFQDPLSGRCRRVARAGRASPAPEKSPGDTA